MKNKRSKEPSPLELLRVFTKSDWDFYQSLVEQIIEAELYKQREEDLAAVIDLFRLLAAKRFPDIQLGKELDTVRDLEGLRKLAHELDRLPTPGALRVRLAELDKEELGPIFSTSFMVSNTNGGG